MNLIYIILIIIILFSFVTGIIVTIAEKNEKVKYDDDEKIISELEEKIVNNEIEIEDEEVSLDNNQVEEVLTDDSVSTNTPQVVSIPDNIVNNNSINQNSNVLDMNDVVDNSSPKIIPYAIVDDEIL